MHHCPGHQDSRTSSIILQRPRLVHQHLINYLFDVVIRRMMEIHFIKLDTAIILKHYNSCRFKHEHSDGGQVKVEVIVGGRRETAAECSLLPHHTLPAPQPQALLHLVLDEAGHLAMDPRPAHVPAHLHRPLGNGDDQQRVILTTITSSYRVK